MLYTLWGQTTVRTKDHQVDPNTGYAYIYFEDFQPLPEKKRPHGLTAEDLLGKPWRRGTFRYINTERVKQLERLI